MLLIAGDVGALLLGEGDVVVAVQETILAEQVDLERRWPPSGWVIVWRSRSMVSTALAPLGVVDQLVAGLRGSTMGKRPFLKQLL